jgi:hypothetical protein
MMMLARARAATTVSAHAAVVVATTRWSSRLARGVLGALDYSDVQVRAHAPGQHARTSFRVCQLPSSESWAHDNALQALRSRCPCSLRGSDKQLLTHVLLFPPVAFTQEHYVGARAEKRRIIGHFGPTNSGKTHNAIKVCMCASECFTSSVGMQAHLWLSINLTCVLDKTTRATATPPSVQQ